MRKIGPDPKPVLPFLSDPGRHSLTLCDHQGMRTPRPSLHPGLHSLGLDHWKKDVRKRVLFCFSGAFHLMMLDIPNLHLGN